MTVIYVVECVVTGHVYVGCTAAKLNRRMNEHMSLLRKQKHTSTRMLEDWKNHGREAFVLRVIERLPPEATLEQRRDAELRWMDHFEGIGKLYNAHRISFGPGPMSKIMTATPEARAKRSAALLGKPKHPGHGAKISATKKALGQRPSLETARLGGLAGSKARYSKA